VHLTGRRLRLLTEDLGVARQQNGATSNGFGKELSMTKQQYGDYQFEIYFDGLEGQTCRIIRSISLRWSVRRRRCLPRGCTRTWLAAPVT